MRKKIVYFDMDGVLADFIGHVEKKYPEFKQASDAEKLELIDKAEVLPEFFQELKPIEGAVEAFNLIAGNVGYDAYILSTASWNSPDAWKDKRLWVEAFLGDQAYKRLILTHNKNLNRGDYLIDDRLANGSEEFEGELIQFGSEQFPDWTSVVTYLLG